MPPSLVNSVNGFFGATGGGTSPSMNTTGAACCVVAVVNNASVGLGAISDSAGNIWTGPFGNAINSQFYITSGNLKTSTTHTFSVVATGPIAFVAIALAGVSALDSQNHNSPGAVTSLPPGPVQPTASGAFVLALVSMAANNPLGLFIDTGYTILSSHSFSANGYGIGVAYFIPAAGTTPSLNPNWSFGGTSITATASAIDLLPLLIQLPLLMEPTARPAGLPQTLGYAPMMFGNISAAVHSISGNVGGVSGVTVMFTGPTSGTTTSGPGGAYLISGLAPGTYVITPSLVGYTFAPPSQTVSLSSFDITGVSFVATYTGAIFSISGNAGLAGATVTWTGPSAGSTTADPSGNYSIVGLLPGSYTVTPSGTGYAFTPPSQVVVITSANITGVNFTAAPIIVGHSISGNVGVKSVTVNWAGASASGAVTADASGNYVIPGLADGNYTVTPRLGGYSFSPTSRGVTIAGANLTGVNFAATNLAQLPITRDPTAAPAPGQIIPLTVSPNQTFSVNLTVDGDPLTLNLAVHFSSMAGYWVLSIYDQSQNIILDSLPMITGWYPAANILGQYGYLNIGSAYLLNQGTDASDYPGSSDLGTGFQLLWGDTEP